MRIRHTDKIATLRPYPYSTNNQTEEKDMKPNLTRYVEVECYGMLADPRAKARKDMKGLYLSPLWEDVLVPNPRQCANTNFLSNMFFPFGK